MSLNIIQRQLGHAKVRTTSIYLQGIDPRRSSRPSARDALQMMSASAGLQL
jgi:integrase